MYPYEPPERVGMLADSVLRTGENLACAATKADATDIALLVNIATHGGIGIGWTHAEGADEAYDPAEMGRLERVFAPRGDHRKRRLKGESTTAGSGDPHDPIAVVSEA